MSDVRRDDESRQRGRIAAQDVIEIAIVLDISDYTQEGVDVAIGNYFNCVDLLAREEVGRMVLAGVVSSVTGFGALHAARRAAARSTRGKVRQ
jgi:hypothetical protein